jgi:hypothetical protein
MKYSAATYLDSVNLDRAPQPTFMAALQRIAEARLRHPLACHSIYRTEGSKLLAQWELGKLTVNRARNLIETCPACKGTGAEFPGHPRTEKCEECDGVGYVPSKTAQ